MKIQLIILFSLSTLISACSFFSSESNEINEPVIARAYDNSLYPSDLNELIPSGTSAKDSADRVDQFIDNWLRQQAIVAEAKKDTTLNLKMIDRKVEEMRDQLLLYEFQKTHVLNNLDANVTQAEIDTFYAKHIEEFKLTKNVFKGLFIKVSKTAPDVAQTISQFYSSSKPEALEELKKYCVNFASIYYIQDSSWTYIDDILNGTPYENVDQKQLLTSYKYSQRVDSQFHYLLKINEYRLVGDESPVELHRDEIKALLIGQRKQKLLSDLENNLYEKAVMAKEITRFD